MAITTSVKNYTINGVAITVTATNDSVASPNIITLTAVGNFTQTLSADVSQIDQSQLAAWLNSNSQQLAQNVSAPQDTNSSIMTAITNFGP